MGPFEIIETLPDLEPGVELLEPRDDHSFQLAVELFVVNAVRALRLPVQVGTSRSDVAVLDAAVEYVPMELGSKLTPVVGLDALDAEGQPGEDLVHEGDGGLLSVALIDLEDANPGAVIDGGVLIVRSCAVAEGAKNLTSSWIWCPGRGFSYRW